LLFVDDLPPSPSQESASALELEINHQPYLRSTITGLATVYIQVCTRTRIWNSYGNVSVKPQMSETDAVIVVACVVQSKTAV